MISQESGKFEILVCLCFISFQIGYIQLLFGHLGLFGAALSPFCPYWPDLTHSCTPPGPEIHFRFFWSVPYGVFQLYERDLRHFHHSCSHSGLFGALQQSIWSLPTRFDSITHSPGPRNPPERSLECLIWCVPTVFPYFIF